MQSRLTFALGSVLATTACQSEPVEIEECTFDSAETIEGEIIKFVAVGHDFGEFCSDGFAIAEAHAAWVADAWGEPALAFDYQLFESDKDACWPCNHLGPARPCIHDGGAATTNLVDRHEIAHAVRGTPCSFPLIEEGWAMLYGDHFFGASTAGDVRQAVADIEQTRKFANEYYPLAERFVAFLIETRGIESLRELCGIPQGGLNDLDFDGALTLAYGQSLEELATEFDDYPEWSVSELRQDQACEDGDAIVSPGAWSLSLECGAPGVEGKRGKQAWAHQLIELPQPGLIGFTFEVPVDLDLEVELRHCTREGMASIHHQYEFVDPKATDPAVLVLYDLPVGVYVLRVRIREPIVDAVVQVSVGPWP